MLHQAQNHFFRDAGRRANFCRRVTATVLLKPSIPPAARATEMDQETKFPDLQDGAVVELRPVNRLLVDADSLVADEVRDPQAVWCPYQAGMHAGDALVRQAQFAVPTASQEGERTGDGVR